MHNETNHIKNHLHNHNILEQKIKILINDWTANHTLSIRKEYN